MKVTIIIPNYNGCRFMEPCLASLKEQTFKDCCHGRKPRISARELSGYRGSCP